VQNAVEELTLQRALDPQEIDAKYLERLVELSELGSGIVQKDIYLLTRLG
jgi:hypothetical protein